MSAHETVCAISCFCGDSIHAEIKIWGMIDGFPGGYVSSSDAPTDAYGENACSYSYCGKCNHLINFAVSSQCMDSKFLNDMRFLNGL